MHLGVPPHLRYPAEKILVVNLPGVEVGSIIEYEVNTKVFDQSFYHEIIELNDFDPIEKTKNRNSYAKIIES